MRQMNLVTLLLLLLTVLGCGTNSTDPTEQLKQHGENCKEDVTRVIHSIFGEAPVTVEVFVEKNDNSLTHPYTGRITYSFRGRYLKVTSTKNENVTEHLQISLQYRFKKESGWTGGYDANLTSGGILIAPRHAWLNGFPLKIKGVTHLPVNEQSLRLLRQEAIDFYKIFEESSTQTLSLLVEIEIDTDKTAAQNIVSLSSNELFLKNAELLARADADYGRVIAAAEQADWSEAQKLKAINSAVRSYIDLHVTELVEDIRLQELEKEAARKDG